MSTRDRIALAIPPLLLRLVLAVTFLWAGLGKALTHMSVSPDGAATLSLMGVAVSNTGPAPVLVPAPTVPASPGSTETAPPPKSGAMANPGAPLGFRGAGFQGAGSTNPPFPADGFSKPKQDGQPEAPKPDSPKPDPKPEPGSAPPTDRPPGSNPFPVATPPAQVPAPVAPTPGAKTAADFPNPEPVRRVYGLALAVHAAANPPMTPAGPSGESVPTRMRLLPAELGQGSRPVYMAFSIAAVEIIAGAMLLLGMLSRLWALAIACVMVGAIWLTQIGPAMATGDTVLGFLPNYPWGDPGKWMPLMWQVSLLASALAVFFAGSGAMAVDNAMFGRRGQRALDE